MRSIGSENKSMNAGIMRNAMQGAVVSYRLLDIVEKIEQLHSCIVKL